MSCSTSLTGSLLCGGKLRKDVIQIVNLFPFRFLSMFTEVLHICVLFWGFSFLYSFPNRVIFSFEIRDVFFEDFIPHFLEFWFKFVAYVRYMLFWFLVCEFFDRLTWLLISWGMLFVVCGLLFGVASVAACWSKMSRLLVPSSISSCSLQFIDRFTLSYIICL